MTWLLLALLAIDGGAVVADDEDVPTVSARVDREEVRVGDPIDLVVTTVARRGIAVNLPAQLDLGKFSLLEKTEDPQPRDLGDGHLRREFDLKVAAYEPGDAQIPALEVTYLTRKGEVRTVTTSPIDIKVTALLANVDQPDLKDIAPPVRVYEQVVWPFYVLGGIFAVVLVGLVAISLSRRFAARAQAAAPPPPPRPAHEVALARLDALRAEGLLEKGEWKPFHFAVSEIIREYLGGRYGFDSLEMTTTELLDAVRRAGAGDVVQKMVTTWCEGCDLVKFAKYIPSFSEAQATLEGAYRIIDATRVREDAAVKLEAHAAA